EVDEKTVEITRAVRPLENVIVRGEDIPKGGIVCLAGHRLRPQDIGLLAGLGITDIPVRRKPKVAILSTGDEVASVEACPLPGQIRDVNSQTLGAMIAQRGGLPLQLGIVGDDFAAIAAKCAEGLEIADAVLVSGGSSVGLRDYTVKVFQSFDGAVILAHGVSISPGKPTILARVGSKSLWGLPGHVTSAMVVFELFVGRLLDRLLGIPPD
ncbi:MAG: molybdopterin molybdotransferase MoeA, partial [Deltaproteobacteria bacterium]|nr:molybdopterin molybdotransferase MoeA [Deltaproteobacteria bacterium]